MWTIVILICSTFCTTTVSSSDGVHTDIFRSKAECEAQIDEIFYTLQIPRGKIADAQCVNWFRA